MTDHAPLGLFSLQRNDFADAFPFGFIVDSGGYVTLAGRGLAKRLSCELPCAVECIFEAAPGRRELAVLDGLRAGRKGLKLKVVGTEIVLRGEGLPLASGEEVAFVGSPQVSTLKQLARCELKLTDFSSSDATPDLLMSMQVTRAALDDARGLSARLRESVHEAEESARVKGQFLAVMSHEIRTPMNGLGSMVDLLTQTPLSPEQVELTQTIDDCAQSLQALLNDILDLSKLDAKSLDTEMIPLRLPELIGRVVRVFQAMAKKERVELTARIAPQGPEWILGDPTRIRQVLSNLVSNAIKFSAGGEVVVGVGEAVDDQLTIRVEDTGIGIPEEAQARVFEPFTQADASTTRQFGGTGLGLSIARGLARAMGGDLRLTSTNPSGSTFDFVLPALAVDAAPTDAEASASQMLSAADPPDAPSPEFERSELSVLVVDDNPVNLVIARRLIEKLGASAETCESGPAALEVLRETTFDLVLLDLMMPRMSGVETVKAIRGLPGESRHVPVVAFSADMQPAAKADAIAAGMQDFLEKPVRLASMRAMLASFVRSAG